MSAAAATTHALPTTAYRSCGVCGYVEGCVKCSQEGHWCPRVGDAPVWNHHEVDDPIWRGMAEYEVTLHVDGMIYLTVEASTENEAAKKAEAMVGHGDFVEIEAVHVVVDERVRS